MLSVRVPPAELNISAPPPSTPRLGNQRPWYVRSRLYATGHIKDPVPLIEKRRGLSPGGRFPHPEDGLRCGQGVTPPLKLKLITLFGLEPVSTINYRGTLLVAAYHTCPQGIPGFIRRQGIHQRFEKFDVSFSFLVLHSHSRL